MKYSRNFLRARALIAFCFTAMVACQNSTESTSSSTDSIVATAQFTMGNATRLPDSIAWKAPGTSGSQKISCPELTCTEIFHLPQPLGDDSLTLELCVPYRALPTRQSRFIYSDPF